MRAWAGSQTLTTKGERHMNYRRRRSATECRRECEDATCTNDERSGEGENVDVSPTLLPPRLLPPPLPLRSPSPSSSLTMPPRLPSPSPDWNNSEAAQGKQEDVKPTISSSCVVFLAPVEHHAFLHRFLDDSRPSASSQKVLDVLTIPWILHHYDLRAGSGGAKVDEGGKLSLKETKACGEDESWRRNVSA